MSSCYGVMTVDRGGKVAQTSRSGDDWAKADVSIIAANGGDWTFRLEVDKEGFTLMSIPKRWKDANATPEAEWEILAEGEI